MTVDEIKNKAYQMARVEEYSELDDILENFLCMEAYAAYRLYILGAISEFKARAWVLRAQRDFKVLSIHREMYMKNSKFEQINFYSEFKKGR